MNKQWQISETVQLACLDGLMFGRDEAGVDIELSSNVHNSDMSYSRNTQYDVRFPATPKIRKAVKRLGLEQQS